MQDNIDTDNGNACEKIGLRKEDREILLTGLFLSGKKEKL